MDLTEGRKETRAAYQETKGVSGLKKRDPGSIFFFSSTLGGLTNYVIRHTSKYGNIMSSSLHFPSLTHNTQEYRKLSLPDLLGMPKGIVALSESLRRSGAFMSPREKRTLKKTLT